MSLISDALKEAQRKRGEKRESPPSLPTSSLPERKRKRQRPFLGLTVFAGILLAFLVFFYFQMDKILKIRNRNIVKPATSRIEMEESKPPMVGTKTESIEIKKETTENLVQTNTLPENQKSEPKEKTSFSLQPIPEIPPPHLKQKNEKKEIIPQKIHEEIPAMGEEKEVGQIEIIRSSTSSEKSEMEEKFLEIERAEKNNDWGKACSLWEKIIEKNEKKEYFLNAGVAYKNTGNWNRAEELFLKALALDPRYLSALNNLGVLYLEKKDYDKAIEYLGNALRISPEDSEIYVNIGIAFFKKNEFQKAVACFDETLKLNSKLYQPYYYLGIIYLNQRDREKALFNFIKLLEIAPEDFSPELRKWVKEKIDILRIPNP